MSAFVEIKVTLDSDGEGGLTLAGAELLAEGVEVDAVTSILLAGILGHEVGERRKRLEEALPFASDQFITELADAQARFELVKEASNLPNLGHSTTQGGVVPM
jgi:hypothetical protein